MAVVRPSGIPATALATLANRSGFGDRMAAPAPPRIVSRHGFAKYGSSALAQKCRARAARLELNRPSLYLTQYEAWAQSVPWQP